jgi:hypothetical protein
MIGLISSAEIGMTVSYLTTLAAAFTVSFEQVFLSPLENSLAAGAQQVNLANAGGVVAGVSTVKQTTILTNVPFMMLLLLIVALLLFGILSFLYTGVYSNRE